MTLLGASLGVVAVGVVAAVSVSCSSSSQSAEISRAEAQTLAEALTLAPSDVGAGFIEYTEGLSEDVDLADCTSEVEVLAQAPARSYGTDLDDVDASEAATATEDIQQIIVKSLVYDSAAAARSAFEVLDEQLRAGPGAAPGCLGDQTVGASLEPSGESLPGVDDSVVLGTPEGPTFVLVRNGPSLSLLVPLFGSFADNSGLVARVADQLSSAVADASS